MISVIDWFVPAVIGVQFILLGSLKLYGLQRNRRRRGQALYGPTLWDVTDLGEPQFTAWSAATFPGNRPGKPCLGRLDFLVRNAREMN